MLQFIILELVLDRLAARGPRNSVAIARREDVADVVEPRQARRRLELLRQRDHDFRPARDLQVAAERPAEVVLGTQAALFISAHRLRAAAVELPIWRQGRGVADVHAVGEIRAQLQREPAKQRDVLDELVARDVVLHVADAGQRVGQAERVPHAAIGKQRAIAAVVIPRSGEFDRVVFGAPQAQTSQRRDRRCRSRCTRA